MALGPKGVDVRQSSGQIVFRSSLKDSAGAKVTSGTTVLTLYEYQSDGTLKSYDFNDNTFKTTALTTATLAMTHRTGNNGGTNTGLWTVALATLTGFTAGGVYMAQVNNTLATPVDQEREFQFGSAEGDLSVTTTGYLKTDTEEWKGGTIPAVNVTGVPKVDVVDVLGTAPTGTADDDLTFLRNVAEGDWSIDKTTDPAQWAIVIKIKSTATELVRKKLRDVDGSALTATTTVIGSAKES